LEISKRVRPMNFQVARERRSLSRMRSFTTFRITTELAG
jgi:hypothetical protein